MLLEGYPNDSRPSLSARLRDETADVHDAAERSPFMTTLLAGEGPFPVDAYLQLLAQYLSVYAALETAAAGLRGDPLAAPFLDPGLDRRAAIESDLLVLGGPDWADRVAVTMATHAYVDRIREVADWPGGFIAHHYVRYLGDLSGGQIIRRILRRRFELDGDDGLAFYVFDRIDNGVQFKKDYRDRLDRAPWPDAEADLVVSEARRAFEHNVALFGSLEPFVDVVSS